MLMRYAAFTHAVIYANNHANSHVNSYAIESFTAESLIKEVICLIE